MGDKNQTKFEEEELDTLDDFDGDLDFEELVEDPVELARKLAEKKAADEERRIKARREIERRNELKALNSELDDWDELLSVDDL